MIYTLIVDQIERRVLTDRAAMIALLPHGEGIDIPEPDEVRAEFDAALTAGPDAQLGARSELLYALGLRGSR